jgi:catechol 2,3-dioxygenase-like lactoylglutathione lyase family enzyme
LYVSDQTAARDFFVTVLGVAPRLDVPGMTEIALPGGGVLGLMPEAGIRRLLGDALPDPASSRPPRAELYLVVDDVIGHHARALAGGAKELSPPAVRSWGHFAAYSLGPDGHVVAFASIVEPRTRPGAD